MNQEGDQSTSRKIHVAGKKRGEEGGGPVDGARTRTYLYNIAIEK